MKKYLSLFTLLVFPVAITQAQNLKFCTADGTEIPSGSILEFHNLDPDTYENLDMAVIYSGIHVTNTSLFPVQANLTCSVTELTDGWLSCCLGDQCRLYDTEGVYQINGISLAPGRVYDAQLHPFPIDLGEYYTISTTLTLGDKTGENSTIYVKFVYNAESPVASLDAAKADKKAVKYYDLLGRETKELKGVLIEKMSDGRCRKVRFN